MEKSVRIKKHLYTLTVLYSEKCWYKPKYKFIQIQCSYKSKLRQNTKPVLNLKADFFRRIIMGKNCSLFKSFNNYKY